MVYDQTKEVDNSSRIWEFKNESDNIQKNEIRAQEKKINSAYSRKIKPIQNPALKLKTPIAYQRDSDPNMLPIEKEGRGKIITTIIFIEFLNFSYNYIFIGIVLNSY